MKRPRRLFGCAGAVALVLALSAATPGSAQEPGTETLTIYGAVCPVDYVGEQFFVDCFPTPAAGGSYQVRNIEAGTMRPEAGGFATADEGGTVAFEDLSGLVPGTIQILAMAPDEVALPGGYTVPAVECTANEERSVDVTLLDTAFTGRIVELEVLAGDDLRCDFYFVPLSPQGTTDEAPPGTGPPTVPSPGRSAAVFEGACPIDDGEPADVIAELTAPAAPAGEPVGQAGAVVAETSFTTIPLSLDELLAGDYAIGVGSLGEDDPRLVACGEVGGILDGNGSLAIGLREIGDSGFTGIAFLAPAAGDPSQTDVSVFLAAGLAENDAAGTPPAG